MRRDPKDFERLPPDEVARLIRLCQRTGDSEAVDRLVRGHLPVVARIARQYRWSRHEAADLVQAGTVGLLRAIAKFEPERGFLLSTYATLWIRALILRFVHQNWRLVRYGTTPHQRRSFFRARALGHDASPADRSLLRHMTKPELSLDAPIGVGEDGSRLGIVSCLRAPDGDRPDVRVERAEARARFRAAVHEFAQGLEGRERRIFAERWLGDDSRTLTSIGKELGVSRERTGKIERRLLGRLESFLSARLGDLHLLAPALAAA